MMTTIPEAEALQHFAAVIVDAAALRENDSLSAQALRALESWETPMLWIDTDPPRPPQRDKLIVVKRPLSRKAMREALALCLGQSTAAAAKEPNVIELVDVVEAGPSGKQIKSAKKKKL